MRFTRLVIETEEQTVSLNLHRRLTVVSGVDERVRTGLIGELVGGLTAQRRGLRLDVETSDGRHLTVERPTNGDDTVRNGDDGSDLTEEFRTADGTVDLLDGHGLDLENAVQTMYVDRSRLAASATRNETVQRLAELDQTELWSCAARVRITDEQYETLNSGMGEASENAEVVARIEDRHHALIGVLDFHRRLRRHTASVAGVAMLAALIVTRVDPTMALPILGIGAAALAATFVYRARVEAAERSERKALAEAGAKSYLGFMVQRVDGMLAGNDDRKRMHDLADDHRAAAMRWTQLVGDVTVEWALAHHEEIEAASHLRRQLRSLSQVSTTAPELDEDIADLAHALHGHLGRVRHVGVHREAFPLILDDPFIDLPSSTRLALLELIARAAGVSQVIVLTEQEDVATWARLEALTGEVALVEPRTDVHPTSSTPASATNLAV